MPQPANWGLVLDPEALYVALDAHRRRVQRRQGRVSWRAVADEAGVSLSVFSRLGVGHSNLHANVLIKLLAWMGETDLRPYIRDLPAPTLTGF